MNGSDSWIYLDDVPKENLKDYIGNGYRSCCYMIDHDRTGKIVLFGYDKSDNPAVFVFPWQSHIKYNVKYRTAEQDLYGHFVETKYFKNSRDRNKYIENSTGLNIVECLSGLFSMSLNSLGFIITIISNILYISIGIFFLIKMFDSKRIIFNK